MFGAAVRNIGVLTSCFCLFFSILFIGGLNFNAWILGGTGYVFNYCEETNRYELFIPLALRMKNFSGYDEFVMCLFLMI